MIARILIWVFIQYARRFLHVELTIVSQELVNGQVKMTYKYFERSRNQAIPPRQIIKRVK